MNPEDSNRRPRPNAVLAVLTLVYVFNFIDRNVMNSLVEPIKGELGLSDTAMGLLTGPAFVVFYALAGLPIARWADRGPRVTILSLGLAFWSVMTAACGYAANFAQLALARVGVGIGEASGVPTSQSILADTFPPERIFRTLAIYSVGIQIGILFGMLAGGWIGEFFGWRMAFVAVGLPGIALAVGVWLSIPEPVRGRFEAPGASDRAAGSGETWGWLLGLRSYRWLLIGAPLSAMAGYAYSTWSATFFIRVHEMSVGVAATWVGIAALVGGTAGTLAGGAFADRLNPRDRRWPVWLIMICLGLEVPLGYLTAMSPSGAVAVAANCAFVFVAASLTGPIFGLMISLAPAAMRATSSATYLFVANMVGLGGGPLLVGVLNDAFQPRFGDEAIRFTLLSILVVSVIAAGILGSATRTLRADLDRTLAWGPRNA